MCADHRQDDLVELVDDFPRERHRAAVRLGLGGARLGRRGAEPQRVAGAHRLDKPDLLDAGRADTGALVEVAVAHQPHAHARGLPAACDQAAVGRGAGLLLVGVVALGIPLPREGDDVLRRKRACAELERPAGMEVVEVVLEHGGEKRCGPQGRFGRDYPRSRNAAGGGRSRRLRARGGKDRTRPRRYDRASFFPEASS